jgi:hypothetical protein
MREFKDDDIFVEVTSRGNFLKVTVIHNKTGLEATATGPRKLGDKNNFATEKYLTSHLTKLALKKLQNTLDGA